MSRVYLLFLCLGCLAFGDEIPDHLSEKQEISFYRGYLIWQDYLQRPGVAYDLEQIIAGMRAAEKGKFLLCDEDSLQAKLQQFQEDLLAKQTVENLADAEKYLADVAREGAIELIPGMLYYHQLSEGKGEVIRDQDIPTLTYSVWSYDRWGEVELISFEDPLPISLQNTIPGFAKGVVGMKEGEERKLFIHPDLGYGTYGKLDPNQLLIIQVKILSKKAL